MIFEDHWDEFKSFRPSFATQYYEDVVQKMLGCGREEGGYSEYLCVKCGLDLRRVAFTCKSCFCLSCSKAYTDDFVSHVGSVLQAGLVYCHMVQTVPEQLRIQFYRNRLEGKLLTELMRCGYECLEDVVSPSLTPESFLSSIFNVISTKNINNISYRSFELLNVVPY